MAGFVPLSILRRRRAALDRIFIATARLLATMLEVKRDYGV